MTIRSFLNWLTFRRSVALLVGLNFIDALSTHALLSEGLAYEANPIMAWAWDQGPAIFWVLKFGLVCAGLLLIGKAASEQVARRLVHGQVVVYLIVLAIHVFGWLSFLWQ